MRRKFDFPTGNQTLLPHFLRPPARLLPQLLDVGELPDFGLHPLQRVLDRRRANPDSFEGRNLPPPCSFEL